MTAIRDAIYERSGGRCEIRKSPNCIIGILPFSGVTPFDHGHLVHMKGKRMHGTTLEISKWGCWWCHLIEMHRGGKVVPAKDRNDGQ